jgi:hypothetical protein
VEGNSRDLSNISIPLFLSTFNTCQLCILCSIKWRDDCELYIGRVWKDVVMDYFKVPSKDLPGGI